MEKIQKIVEKLRLPDKRLSNFHVSLIFASLSKTTDNPFDGGFNGRD
jgi:hypothetical protein